MFVMLAVILLAVATFTVLVVRRRVGPGLGPGRPAGGAPTPRPGSRPASRPAKGPSSRSGTLDEDSLRGFFYVGAGALALLAVAVLILGLLRPASGRAEALAVLGFFAYAAYLAAALVVLWWARPRG